MKISDIFDNFTSMIDKTNHTSTTIDTYKYKLATALKYLEDCEVDSITGTDVQSFLDDLSQKYASKTVRGIYDVVNAAFKEAVQRGEVRHNPFENCAIQQVKRHIPIILSREQIDALLEAARSSPGIFLPVFIAIETGLRRSQVLALLWRDVDFANSTISVNKNLLSAKARSFSEGKEHQRRIIMMSDNLSQTLLLVRNQRRNNGVKVTPDDYICLTDSQKALEPTYLDKLFRKLVLQCKDIPDKLRFHDLRWTFINEEVVKGNDPMSIADKVGHKSCIFTMDYYYRFHQRIA